MAADWDTRQNLLSLQIAQAILAAQQHKYEYPDIPDEDIYWVAKNMVSRVGYHLNQVRVGCSAAARLLKPAKITWDHIHSRANVADMLISEAIANPDMEVLDVVDAVAEVFDKINHVFGLTREEHEIVTKLGHKGRFADWEYRYAVAGIVI